MSQITPSKNFIYNRDHVCNNLELKFSKYDIDFVKDSSDYSKRINEILNY